MTGEEQEMGILAGIFDRAKAFTRVGVNKAGSAATGAAASAVNKASEVASDGAARLNEAADHLPDRSDGSSDNTGSGSGTTS